MPFILHDIFCTRHQVVTDSLFCQQVKIPLHDSLPWERLNAELLGTLHTEMEEEDEIQEGREKIFRYKICDSWQINFSLVHASQGENSCSQTASGSWYTADPTQGLYHSGSHPPEEQGAPYCGRVSIFYGTDPGAAVPWLRKKRQRGHLGHISWHPSFYALHKTLF